MTDQQLLEHRVRETLATRADGVAATPVLWERVRRRHRRQRRRRALALAGVTAAVLALTVGVGTLLDGGVPDIDVAPRPEEVPAVEALPEDVAAAVRPGGGGCCSTVVVGSTGRRVDLAGVVSRLVPVPDTNGATGVLVVVSEDGAGTHVGGTTVAGGDADGLDWVVEQVTPNGAGVVAGPAGQAVAWLEARELVVVPLHTPNMARRFTLPDTSPEDLVLQQWVREGDDGVLLASRPAGGLWRIAAEGRAEAELVVRGGPAAVEGTDRAVDGAYLPDGTLALLVDDAEAGLLVEHGGDAVAVPDRLRGDVGDLGTVGGWDVLLAGPDGAVWTTALTPEGAQEPSADERLLDVPGVTAATLLAPPRPAPVDGADGDVIGVAPAGLPPASGLVVGLGDGTRIVTAGSGAFDPGVEALPGQAARLGHVAAATRPSPVHGSEGVQLAVEVVRDDGGRALHHVGYLPGAPTADLPAEAEPVGPPFELPGPLTGLVWVPGEDERVVWSTATAWGVLAATPDGLVEHSRSESVGPLRGPVVDVVTRRVGVIDFPDVPPAAGVELSIGFGAVGAGTERVTIARRDDDRVVSEGPTEVDPDRLVVRLADASGWEAVELSVGPGLIGVDWTSPDGAGRFPRPEGFEVRDLTEVRLVPGTGRAVLATTTRAWTVGWPGAAPWEPGGVEPVELDRVVAVQ